MPAIPSVNGNSFSYVQIELSFGLIPVCGFKDISYDDDLKRANVFGTASSQIGLTRGVLTQKGSIDFYKSAFLLAMLNQLGPGFRQTPFQMVISYGPNDQGLIQQDVLPQVLIGTIDSANAFSEDGPPLSNKVGLYLPSPILWNGIPSVIETFPYIAVA